MEDQHVSARLLVAFADLFSQPRLGGLNLLSDLRPHRAKLPARLGLKRDQPPIDAIHAINQTIQSFGHRVHFVFDDRGAISRRGCHRRRRYHRRWAIAIGIHVVAHRNGRLVSHLPLLTPPRTKRATGAPLRGAEKRPRRAGLSMLAAAAAAWIYVPNRLGAQLGRSAVANQCRRRSVAAKPFYLLRSRRSRSVRPEPPVPKSRAVSKR